MSDLIKVQDSRRTFIDTLIELAEQDPAVCLIVCDVGFLYIDAFKEKFPDRFFNFGVTEPSAMLIAAGMALSGKKPYIYSMINFVTARTHEPLRNAVMIHGANVKVLGVKGSAHYRMLGKSHNLLWEDEEIEWVSKLMPCYKPQGNDEVRQTILDTHVSNKAAYIRLA